MEPQTIMEQSLSYRNYLADKKKNNAISLIDLGFSNDGRLPKYTPPKAPKKTAGLINFIKSLRP